jgi:Lambda phage tail tape-measure protein (Tape_meas_lam_C)
MPEVAGKVNVVLSVNAVNFTAAMKEAQANLDRFAGKSKTAGHTAVTSVQAVSANLRAMEGGFENNLRAVERWIAQSKVATTIAKTMFPIIGALTFGGMIVDMGMKVADFIEKANAMPKAIERGFASMQLASQTSTDSLRLTNDQLENSIAKLEGKPQNNLAIQFDEAAKAADKLATSIENGNSKMNSLLSANHLSGWAILTGKLGTGERENSIKNWGNQQNDSAYDLATATSKGDKNGIAKAQSGLKATQDAELNDLRGDLSNRQANSHNAGAFDDSANMNIDKGAITAILNQQQEQAELVRNSKDEAQKASLDADKAAREAALEAQKKADAAAIQQQTDAHLTWSAFQNRSKLEEVLFWSSLVALKNDGSKRALDAQKHYLEATVALNREQADGMKKTIDDFSSNYTKDYTARGGLNSDTAKDVNDSGKDSVAYITSLRQSIDLNKENSTTLAENSIQMAVSTGQMTKQAAAYAMAALHQQEYRDGLQKLKDEQAAIQSDPTLTDVARKAELQNNANQQGQLNTRRTIRIGQDSQAVDPGFTSATVGAADALNDFVKASRDSAGMMRELVNSTLNSLNSQIANAMSGGKTSFGQVGKSALHGIATTGLKKAEGSTLSLISGGKLGGGKPGESKNKPLWTKSVDGISGAPGADKAPGAASAISKVGGGMTSILGKMGGFGGLLGKAFGMASSFLPFLASGGPIDGPAIVGEKGPELFMPDSAGKIVPNHALTSASASGGSNGDIYYSINAQGTDPVQTEQRVRSAIVAAHQSAVTQSVKQVSQDTSRRPRR